jgi:hypothetical protein
MSGIAQSGHYDKSCPSTSNPLPGGRCDIITCVVLILRRLLAALAIVVASVMLAAPAAASLTHGVDHFAAPVSVGEHHHHATGGEVDIEDDRAPTQTNDPSTGKSTGHSHPPTGAADPALFGSAIISPPLIEQYLQQDWSVRELATLTWSPHRRPPRTA